MNEMMHIDRMGGGGKESAENREKLRYDDRHLGGMHPVAGEGSGAEEVKPEEATPAGAEGGSGTQGAPATQGAPGAQDMQHDGHAMPGMDHGTGGAAAPAQPDNN